jgi:hypothetical protein
MHKVLSKSLIFELLLFILVLTALLYKLGFDFTHTDQFRWIIRSENFKQAIFSRNFSDTYQQYHPGVTIMHLVSLGQETFKLFVGADINYEEVTPEIFGVYNFFTKFFVVLLIFILIVWNFYLIKKLFNQQIASFFTILLVLEPYFLGTMRNLHLDGILTMLIFSSILTFYAASVLKSSKLAIVSGLLTGLSFLTKTPSLIILPFILLILLIVSNSDQLNSGTPGKRSKLLTYLASRPWKALAITAAVGLITIFVLFPALWEAPIDTVNKIVTEGIIDTGYKGGHNHYINNIRTRNPGLGYYFTVLKYRVSPLLMAAIVPALLSFLVHIAVLIKSQKDHAVRLGFLSLIFTVLYVAIFTYMTKKTDRYVVPIFPFVILFISLGLGLAGKYLRKLLNLKSQKYAFPITLAVVLILNGYEVLKIFPHFFAYYSPIFGGISSAKQELYLNQGGTALIEVANYLNQNIGNPETLIGTFNSAELQPWVRAKVSTLGYAHRGSYDYMVLPIQRGDEYLRGYSLEKTFYINESPYWMLYKKK